MVQHDVVVVGGGFSGLGVAAALAGTGARVTVLESARTVNPAFRGELIHPRGVRALRQLGLSKPLFEAGGVPVEGFAVTPGADQDAMVLPYRAGAGTGLGIDHATMVMTLRREVAARPGVTIHTSTRAVDLERAGERVTGVRTADGRSFRADLVVLADGRQSKLRVALGLDPEIKLLSHTIAFAVTRPLPWGARGHVFLGGPGPILAYPYGEGQVRFCVDLPVGAAKGKEAIAQYLISAYAPFVPSGLREGMVETLRALHFEACATHSISTDACAAPGVVLLGDAGGCGHPLTASGMTNAMNDVLTLASLVGQRGVGDDVLTEYQRRRYDFVRMRELFTEALYEVFRAHDSGSKALQHGVFKYWRSSERARSASMDILAGEDVRTRSFVTEYSRVFGVSALDVIKRAVKQPSLRSRGRELRSLVKTSFGRLEVAMTRTARTWVDRYRLGLHRASAPSRPGAHG